MSKYSDIFQKYLNYSVPRKRGEIPGCVPAVDVFIDRSPEEVHQYLIQSALRYVHIMQTTDAKLWKNHPIHNERALPVFRNDA